MTWKPQFVTTLVLIGASCSFGAVPVSVEVVEVKRIWDQAPHNAFTDLVRWNHTFYCAFREGRGHVSTDGKIRVLESKEADTWASAALISLEGYDLRDAHLSITPDERLMLLGGAAPREKDNQSAPTGSFVSFSKDGKQWTEPQIAVEPGRWLWCVTWYKGKAYGVSYAAGPGDRYLDLLISDDGIHYRPHVARLFGQGYPTEVTLRFDADGTCYALVRRDRRGSDPYSAMLGVSQPDYKQWQWKDLGTDFNGFGGPNFIQIPGGHWLAAGRMHDGGAHTTLCYLDVQNGTMTRLLKLPSGGDTSYPGLVWHNNMLYMSYYSSHEVPPGTAGAAKTSIYLARLKVRPNPAVETAPSATSKSFLSAEQILAAWESTYGSIRTMKVSYSDVLEDYRPPASNPQEPPPVKYTHVKRVEDGRRYHIRFSTAETGFNDPESLTERAFDGTVTKDFLAAKKSGSIFLGLKGTSLETENFLKMYMLLETHPYLREKYPNGVPAFVLSLTRALAAGGVTVRPSLETVAGQLCHVVEVVFPGRDYKGVPRQGKKLFWMAHDRGMCLMKYQRYWDEELFDEMEVEQVAVAEMDGTPIWYPQKAHWVLFQDENGMTKRKLNVTEFVPNVQVDENTFHFDFPKGTHVFDKVRGISGVDLPREPPSLVGKSL